MKKTAEQRAEAVRQIKSSVSFLKSNLIATSDQLRVVSAREAHKLDRIIARLEDWQNTGWQDIGGQS